MKDKFSRGFKGLKILGLIFAALIIVLTMNPFVIIGAGERGVILNFGAVQPAFYFSAIHSGYRSETDGRTACPSWISMHVQSN